MRHCVPWVLRVLTDTRRTPCTLPHPQDSGGHQDGRRVPVLRRFAEGRAVVRIGRRDTIVHTQVLKAGTTAMVRMTTTGRHPQAGDGVVIIEAVAIEGTGGGSRHGRHMAEVPHGELLGIPPGGSHRGGRNGGHLDQAAKARHAVGAVELGDYIDVGAAVGVLADELAAAPSAHVAVKEFQAEEDGDADRCRGAVGLGHRLLADAAGVAQLHAGTGGQERVSVVAGSTAPPIACTGDARAEAALVESVGVLGGVEGGLHVAVAEDDAEQDADAGAVGIPVAFPAVALLAGILAEGLRIQVRGGAAQLGVELAVKLRVVVAAPVLGGGADDGDQLQVFAVHHGDAQGRGGGHRNAVVLAAGDGRQRGGFVQVAALRPGGVVPHGVPPPHVVAHGTVQLGGLARSQLVVVGGVQLAAAVVLVHQVAAKAQQGGKLAQVVQVAHGFAHGGAIVHRPAAAGVAAPGDEAGGNESEFLARLAPGQYQVVFAHGFQLGKLGEVDFLCCHNTNC